MPLFDNFKVYHFATTNEVLTPLQLPTDQPGKAIRGGFYQALLGRFCNNKAARTCGECVLNQTCPVSSLVAPLRDENPRGRDLPRPYTIRPPKLGDETLWLKPGERFEFGFTIFGKTLELLPYVVLALPAMGQSGLGSFETNRGGRGRFKMVSLKTVNLVTGQSHELLDERSIVKTPSPETAMTSLHVEERARQLIGRQLRLKLITPLRLVDEAKLVRRFAFRPFFQRLLERLLALQAEYGASEGVLMRREEYEALVTEAEDVEVVQDRTVWQDVGSYSGRQGKVTPIGGLIGQVTLRGDFERLLPWLVWGEVVQAGKDVVKGNGCYRLEV